MEAEHNQQEAVPEEQNGQQPFMVPLQLTPGQMLIPVGPFLVLVQQSVVLAVLAPLHVNGPSLQARGLGVGGVGHNERGAG